MKLANGMGSVYKLSGRRRKPWVARKTKGWDIDEKTGKTQEQVQETDDNGNPVMKNGEPVMIDDPDGFQPVILKRLPEVTIANKYIRLNRLKYEKNYLCR